LFVCEFDLFLKYDRYVGRFSEYQCVVNIAHVEFNGVRGDQCFITCCSSSVIKILAKVGAKGEPIETPSICW
jgi:hypothetical protein